MELKEAIITLQKHNAWRNGNENIEMIDVKIITESINVVTDNYRYLFAANFFKRLESFISNVQVNDMSSEEEKSMIINVCKHFNKQISNPEA